MLTHKNALRLVAFTVPLFLVSVAFGQELGPKRAGFVTVAKGYYSGQREKQSLVIESREEWQKLWDGVYAILSPKPDLPEVDFSQEIVIAVFQGERWTGGYAITITELAKNGNKLTANVTEESPGNCPTGAALSQPFHIIVVEKVRKVKFKVTPLIHECRQN